MSDVEIQPFFQFFASSGISVSFLVPTPTGYEKSIMDATSPIRELLSSEGIHDYEKQGQGQENKVLVKSYFVGTSGLTESVASLYRPVTKKGDPRIWFKDLKKYCKPCNLLAIIAINKEIYVVNLSNKLIADSLLEKGYAYDIVREAVYQDELVANELLGKIKEIHNKGFLKSITAGDPGVGDTLENALGISRNNSKSPDYKGIELKSTRLTRNGAERTPTRSTLFTKVPDIGYTYREIVEHYGKVQTPRNSMLARLQLYETCLASRRNAYDLQLQVDINHDQLNLMHYEERMKFVSAWYIKKLKETLLTKHRETFWVYAVSENVDGWEFFRYDKIVHTKKPNASLVAPLLEEDKITVDLAAHITEGKWRDHGVLFKMKPEDRGLLFPDIVEYDLTV
jgi:hypothetical protein